MSVNHALPVWMQKTFAYLLIVFLCLLILNQCKALNPPPQILKISGEGKVLAVPDQATVTIGVVSEGVNSVDVKDKNNQKMNQVIAFIKQQGISDKDIKTAMYYVSPKYNYVNGQNNLVGYQANQSMTVRVSGIDKSQAQLEKILDGVVNQGANQIQGVAFGFVDMEKLKSEVREKAVVNARMKAQELVKAAGLSLGRVVNISDSDVPASIPPIGVNFAMASAKSVRANIEPGNEEVVGSVTLLFEVH